MNVLELYIAMGFDPGHPLGAKREYHGRCPACSVAPDSDRFMIFPDENNSHGRYKCRPGKGCGLHGDNVQFCRDFLGMDYKQAVEHCGRQDLMKYGNPAARSAYTPAKPVTAPASPQSLANFSPKKFTTPPDLWRHKAGELVQRCHEALLVNTEALRWLAGRGVNAEAVRKYSLGWNLGDSGKDLHKHRPAWGLPLVKKEGGQNKSLWIPRGLVIPTIIKGEVMALQVRRRKDDMHKFLPNRKYQYIEGGYTAPMVLYPDRRAQVVVEARLDAIACAEAQDQAGAIGLGSVSARPDSFTHQVLERCLKILDALDFGDEKGKMAADGANVWWLEHYPETCERWPVPKGKDPGEAVAAGVDLGAWVLAGLPPVFRVEVARGSFFPVLKRGGGEKIKQIDIVSPDHPNGLLEMATLLATTGAAINNSVEFGLMRYDRLQQNFPAETRRMTQLLFGELFEVIGSRPEPLISAKILREMAG